LGAEANIHAAPDAAPTLPGAGADTIVHPEHNDVAGVGATSTNNLKVAVTGDLPTADGGFAQSGGLGNEFWVTNTENTDPSKDLHLIPSPGLVNVSSFTGRATTLTKAKTDPLRRVQSTATVSIPRIGIMPISLVLVEDEGGSPTLDRAVLVIENFTATVDCMSTPNAGAYQTYSWSARLRWLKDKNPGDGIPHAKYQRLDVSNTSGDPRATIGNPLVYEGGAPANDIYLFQEPGKRGYLGDLGIAFSGSSALSSGQSPDTGARYAGIDSAISVATAPTDSDNADQTSLLVNVGKLRCDALDAR
jgi:hypothetical protein